MRHGRNRAVTVFDYAAAFLLVTSCLFGVVRGATREISTILAFIVAAAAAVFALRFTAPIAKGLVHAAWLANTVAVLATFVAVYAVLRLIAGAITAGVRQTGLSGLDRLIGGAIGVVRAVVVLGGFALLVSAAVPPDRMPQWLSQAKLYPLASAAGDTLRAFAPRGLKMAKDIAPAITGAAAGGSWSDAQGGASVGVVEESRWR
jgi:membrane protein required for colicin V production